MMGEKCICCGREIPEGLQVCPQCEFSGEPHIKDSGNRREFASGAVRDIQEGKGRCDLLPLWAVSYIIDDDILYSIDRYIRYGDKSFLIMAIQFFAKRRFGNIYTALLEVSVHYEEGCAKYGERNWEKGIPLHCFIDSAVRHYLKYRRGDEDERHDRAFFWNLLGALWTHMTKPELIDLPFQVMETANETE